MKTDIMLMQSPERYRGIIDKSHYRPQQNFNYSAVVFIYYTCDCSDAAVSSAWSQF